MRKNKRVYIKTNGKTKLSQKQILNISIKNIIGNTNRRVKKRKKRKKIIYGKKIIKELEPVKSKTELPVYLFKPQQMVKSLTSTTANAQPSYEKLLEEISKIQNAMKLIKTKPIKTEPSKPSKPRKKRNQYTYDSVFDFIINSLNNATDFTKTDKLIIKDLKDDMDIRNNLFKKMFDSYEIDIFGSNKWYKLFNELKKENANTIFGMVIIFITNEYDSYEKITKDELKYINTNDQSQESESVGSDFEVKGFGTVNDEGLYNGEIDLINKRVFKKDFVPVIAKNQLDQLDQYIQPNMKRFGFIINTDPVPQPPTSNGHWRSVYISNIDSYPSIEYYDPLVSTPEPNLIKKLRSICKIINKDVFFKLKVNNLKTQSNTSSTCAYHSIYFLEKRFNNIPWSEATYYNEYMKKMKANYSIKGEKEVSKIIKKYKSYL